MTNKVVIHDQFVACQDFTLDTYWREIIFSCACNKFPRGVKYDGMKNTIYVRYELAGKPKSEVHQVPGDVHERYILLMHIFKELLGLRSEHDIKLSRQELEDIRRRSEIDLDCDWKKLKPRSVRNQILMNYAIAQMETYDLEPTKAKHFYNMIQLGFQFKYLSGDDIEYKAGIIKSISGLEFNADTQEFDLTNSPKSLARVDKPVSRSNYMHQAIDQWAREYRLYYRLQL